MSGATVLSSNGIRAALGLPSGADDRRYGGIVSDSRDAEPGDLFVALEGERVHGADFLDRAAAGGATGAIVPEGREDPSLDLEYFAVPDPLAALGALAARAREASDARVIAITGSSGKTTVKEMVAAALSADHRVYRTRGNLNSQVGLPLTMLRAPAAADFWVLEIGASEPGEIGRLAAIARPDDAIVTTIGPAHLEAFGDESGVLHEKLDLVRGASPRGAVVVGELPAALPAAAAEIRPDTIVAGLEAGAHVRPERLVVEAERVGFDRGGVRVEVCAGGEHHARDALIAVAIAEAVGLPVERAAHGLSDYRPLGHRGAIRRIGGLTVLADCYNANPESFRAAIAQCRDLYPGRRLAAFAGSMLELGDHEVPAHRAIARELLDAGFDVIAASGAFAPAFEAVASDRNGGARVLFDADPEDLRADFSGALGGDEVVLVKASRGARLERVLDWLEEDFAAAASPADAPSLDGSLSRDQR